MQKITVKAIINAPIEKVWEVWKEPKDIEKWAFASDDWEAREAENDVRVDGKFKTIMAAKDGSSSFEFAGVYTSVRDRALLEYDMDDGRHVKVEFGQTPIGVEITETFDPENENTEEVQRSGWQAILDNFKIHVEGVNKQ